MEFVSIVIISNNILATFRALLVAKILLFDGANDNILVNLG